MRQGGIGLQPTEATLSPVDFPLNPVHGVDIVLHLPHAGAGERLGPAFASSLRT